MTGPQASTNLLVFFWCLALDSWLKTVVSVRGRAADPKCSSSTGEQLSSQRERNCLGVTVVGEQTIALVLTVT